MMMAIGAFLASQPLLVLFLTIALGYLLGGVGIKGVSLGSGAVLFVGLAAGAALPRLAMPPVLGSLGLLLFLYGVGIAYGAQFFRGLTSAIGIKANLAAGAAVACALAAALACVRWVPGIDLAHALGAFAGAGTSTAALQAAIGVYGPAPATAYSVAYPLGVALPIVMLGMFNAIAKPRLQPGGGASLRVEEVAVTESAMLGLTLAQATRALPDGVAVMALRRGRRNLLADPRLRLARDDALLLSGTDAQALRAAAARFGPPQPGRILRDRGDLDYERFFVSNPEVAGRRLDAFDLPADLDARILHLRRDDADLAPAPERTLDYGDRVGVIAPRASFPALRALFGDSMRGTSEINYIGIGIGVTLGLAFGAIQWPVPVLGQFSLGFAGLLLVALLLGWRRRTGRFQWAMPLSASLVLRNFGLTLFLAVVGITSGATFVATIAANGIPYLLLGSSIVALLVVVTMAITLFVFKLPFDSVAGIVAGVTGNPAILSFASRVAPTDRPDVGYAMIFPSMTVLKLLLVQVIGLWGP